MKIKADLLRLSNATHDPSGNKLEPEERPAERVVVTEFAVTSTDPNAVPDPKQGLRGEIAAQTTAGELARGFKSMCFQCVAGGSLVMADGRPQPIENLLGAKRTFVNGEWRDIAAWSSSGVKDVVEVRTSHGLVTRVTPDHRIQTDRGWIAAADLREQDLVVGTFEQQLSKKDALDRRAAFLLGALAGDGWTPEYRGKPTLAFCFEPSMLPTWLPMLDFAREFFNSDEKPHFLNDGTFARIFWRNKAATDFAAKVSKTSIPAEVWQSTPEFMGAYLRGLFTTDGSMSVRPRPTATFYQTNKNLIDEVALLLRFLGIHSTVHRVAREGRERNRGCVKTTSAKDIYHLRIARRASLDRFLDLIGFADAARMEPLTEATAKVKDRGTPEHVKSVTLAGKAPTFDISVPQTESFHANGLLVHNCKHFDQAAWAQLRKKWENGTIEERRQLSSVRAALIDTQNAEVQSLVAQAEEDGDVDAALSTMGICRAITETIRDPMIVHATATCPESMPFFQVKDAQTEKAASAAFDDIMRRAQGKK